MNGREKGSVELEGSVCQVYFSVGWIVCFVCCREEPRCYLMFGIRKISRKFRKKSGQKERFSFRKLREKGKESGFGDKQ